MVAREEKSSEFESRLKQNAKELQKLKHAPLGGTQEISLNEAINKGAVDFKGRTKNPAILKQTKPADAPKIKNDGRRACRDSVAR